MDFSLSDHQKLIRDTVRRFMEAEVRPGMRECDHEEKFPDTLDALASGKLPPPLATAANRLPRRVRLPR